MQAIFFSLLLKILPRALGALGTAIVQLIDAARPLVKKVAEDKTFPNGAARHAFVAEQLLPILKNTGVNLIEGVQEDVAGVVTKIAYDAVTVLKK